MNKIEKVLVYVVIYPYYRWSKWLTPCYRKYMGYRCTLCTMAPKRLLSDTQCGWPSFSEFVEL